MTYREKRVKFTSMVARLIIFAESIGYEVAGAYLKRCMDCKVGKTHSFHKDSLAIDLDLYKNGKWLSKTEDHTPLGKYWESIGGTWGGRFNDGNHYSLGED
jgi:hypothetical protein